MVNMKKFLLGCTMVAAGYMATACSSEENNLSGGEKGTVRLAVTADTGFGATATRSIEDEARNNTDRYTVEILDSDGAPVKINGKTSYQCSELPTPIELDNGGYTLKAYYGAEETVSSTQFYVEGTQTFNVNGEDVGTVTVTCTPTCGKVRVNFGDEMDTYFTNYYVVYHTNALTKNGETATLSAETTEPKYLLLDKAGETVTAEIHFTRKSDQKSSSTTKTYFLERNQSWTLNIAPQQDNNGNLGISITIDESTIDQKVDIVIPAEWVTD